MKPQRPANTEHRTFQRKALPSRARRFAPILAILTAGVLVYSNTLRVPFLFDDTIRIVDNASIRTLWPPSVAMANSPRPFATYTFAVNYAIHGYDVWGYHALNLAIHLATGLLLLGVIRRTLLRAGGTLAEHATGVALTVALIWLVHPLQTEAVTYIVQRLESLMGLCYLATLYGFVRAQDSEHPRRWYVVSIVACALGMGCKEVMATAPLVVLWYDRAFVAASWREIVATRKGYYAGLAATWGVLAWAMLRCTADYTEGSLISVKGLTPWTYLLSQAGVIVHYLQLCLWPRNLCLDYGWPVDHSIAEVLPQAVIVMTLLGATVWCIFRHPRWSFLGGWFFLILAPTSSMIPIKDLAFEHRMYLPSMAVIAAVMLGVFLLGRRLVNRGMLSTSVARLLGASIAVAIVLQLGTVTYSRNRVYATPLSLWQDTVAKAPANPRAHSNLACALGDLGYMPEAMEHCREAIRIDPVYAEAYYNLGKALSKSGRTAEAIENFREAVRIDPDYAAAHNNLGVALSESGVTSDAIDHLRQAIRIKSDLAEAHRNLGVVLFNSGRTADAVEQCQEAIRINPHYAEAYNSLGDALDRSGFTDQAIEQYRRAIRIRPDSAESHNSLGVALAKSGQTAEAVEHLRLALRIKPQFLAARCNLGFCYASAGRRREAIEELEQSLRQAETAGQTQLAQTLLSQIRRLRENKP